MNIQKIVLLTALIFSCVIQCMNEKFFAEGKDFYLELFNPKNNQKELLLTIDERYMCKKDIKQIIQSIQLPETIVSFTTQDSNLYSTINNTLFKHLSHFSNLKYLILHNTQLKNFTNIESLKNLVDLRYNGNHNLTSLKGLEKTQLKRLTIHYCSNLHTIEENSLPNTIEALDVRHCGLESLAENELPHRIEYLDASFNELRTIDGLEHCVNLREIKLNHNKIKKLNPLISLIQNGTIRVIDLENNSFTSNKLNTFLAALNKPNVIDNPQREINKQDVVLSLQKYLLTMIKNESLILLKQKDEIDKELLKLAKNKEITENGMEHALLIKQALMLNEIFLLRDKNNNEKK